MENGIMYDVGDGMKNGVRMSGYDFAAGILRILKSAHGTDSPFAKISLELVMSWMPFDNGHVYNVFQCVDRITERVNICTTRGVDINMMWGVPLSVCYDTEIKSVSALTADTKEATSIAEIRNAVEWLKADRMGKIAKNKQRGTVNQAKGNTEERERAARDMKTALNRVHDRMKHGATCVIAECRAVCNQFTPMGQKNAWGIYPDALPLTGADGEPVKPETLAKNYRKRFGTKKARRVKRRTK